MKDYILYIILLILLAFSYNNIKAEDDFDDLLELEDYIEEEYIPVQKPLPSLFKPYESPSAAEPEVILSTVPDKTLIVSICYNDDLDRGYYCKDLP